MAFFLPLEGESKQTGLWREEIDIDEQKAKTKQKILRDLGLGPLKVDPFLAFADLPPTLSVDSTRTPNTFLYILFCFVSFWRDTYQ